MIPTFLDCLHLDPDCFPLDVLYGLDDEQWQEIISLAAGHRVTAVFHNRVAAALRDAGRKAKPADPGTSASTRNPSHIHSEPFRRAMGELRGYTTRLTRDNLRKQADLQAILRRFRDGEIPVILLKGCWLAHAVYEGVALREMVDLDLMVPAGDLERAAEVVMALGYSPHRSLRDMATEMRNKHHLPIMMRDGAVAVELHWNVTHEGRGDYVAPDGFWERSLEIRVMGEPARELSPEDMLLHLCLHLAYQHMFTFGIRPVLDVALLLQKVGVDWHALTRRALEYRWHRGVWITLHLARDLFGAPVPDDALERLADGGGAAFSRVSAPGQGPGAAPAQGAASAPGPELVQTAAEQLLAIYYTRNILSNQMVSMAHKKGVAGKIHHVIRRIFLPREQMGLLYDIPAGSIRVWLYYPIRIAGLLVRQLGFAIGMMRGEKEVMGHVARRERLRAFLQDG